jgi:predicted transcriptional regulator
VFAVMFKEEILENENRRRIYSLIEENEGIHLRELQRLLGMPLTTLEYHLSYMSRKKIIYGEKESQFRRYYTKPLDREDKKLLSALRQKKIREIVLVVMASKGAKYQYIADYLKLPFSTLSFYLKYLVEKGILDREKISYETVYKVVDEDRVAKVLIAYRSSLFDKLIDKALGTWLESYSGKEELKP